MCIRDSISGTCFDRPGFLAMMKEVEAGNVEYLCIKEDVYKRQERWSRKDHHDKQFRNRISQKWKKGVTD